MRMCYSHLLKSKHADAEQCAGLAALLQAQRTLLSLSHTDGRSVGDLAEWLQSGTASRFVTLKRHSGLSGGDPEHHLRLSLIAWLYGK